MNDMLEQAFQVQAGNVALASGGIDSADNYKKRQTVSDSVTYANLEVAKDHRNKTSLRQFKDDRYYKYPIIGTNLSTLGEYGVGLELYFQFIKQFAIIFFIISGISIWPIYENYQGNYLADTAQKASYTFISLANQEGPEFNYTLYSEADSMLDTVKDNQMNITIADLIYTCFFIIFLVYLEIYVKRIIKKRRLMTVTPGSFAVEAKGFPKEPLSAQEVKDHFSQFGEVAEVAFAKDFSGRLFFYSKRAQISIKIGHEKLKNKNTLQLRNLQRQMSIFDRKLYKADNGNVKTFNELPVIRAFIIFNKVEDKKNCLKEYKNSYIECCCCRKMKKHLMFRGKHELKVKQAPEPSNILWENIEYPRWKRNARRIFAIAPTLALMILSIALIYAIKYLQNEIPNENHCSELDVKDESLSAAKQDYTTNDQIYCYCKQQNWYKLFSDSDLNSYCTDYIEKVSLTSSVRFLSSIGIVFINTILRIMLTKLTKFERISTVSGMRMSMMSKVFIAMFINTALITLLVNANFQSLWFVQRLAFKEYLFNGDYKDFSREWYEDVGATIIATLLVSIALPHFINLLIFYPIGVIKRHCCHKKYITQYQMNAAFTGPEFDISSRTSVILTVIFSCYLYSGGIPLLNIVCFVTLVVIYWTDKFLVLRHYRKPPVYSELMYKRVGYFLPFGIMLHCGFSLYMYGSQDIFPREYVPYTDSDTGETYIEDVRTETIGDRIWVFPGRVNIILCGISFLIFVWQFFLKDFLKSKHKNQVLTERAERTYMEELKNLRAIGIHSYNIMENPSYAPLVISMNSTAEQTKKMGASAINNTVEIASKDAKEIISDGQGTN
ncbi:unnamed protein product [Blepharisma stoltei]|uniref:RRM domain-containing protein n=1 Tax=Blepharisma stoltei TaxID=1481888 RepID=A0AAU9ICK5_9CILI|nr:unnamed protein product [Blepharisma stoltei]